MHALITGASSGIGEALARRFAADGYNCTLIARRREQLEAVAASLPRRAHVLPADLTAFDADALITEATDALGPIDVLINNAGVQDVCAGHTLDEDRLDRLLEVNVRAPWHLTWRVLADMVPRGAGAIVNVASISAVSPVPGMAHYAGSKAALAMSSEALRVELAPRGVRVLTVYPGPIHTDMETAARAAYGDRLAARLTPTGDADRLASRVARALRRGGKRVIYPRVYWPAWWLTGLLVGPVQAAAPRVE